MRPAARVRPCACSPARPSTSRSCRHSPARGGTRNPTRPASLCLAPEPAPSLLCLWEVSPAHASPAMPCSLAKPAVPFLRSPARGGVNAASIMRTTHFSCALAAASFATTLSITTATTATLATTTLATTTLTTTTPRHATPRHATPRHATPRHGGLEPKTTSLLLTRVGLALDSQRRRGGQGQLADRRRAGHRVRAHYRAGEHQP